jgi:RimJ/RimL family protein N-acetyltransferase
LSGTARLREPSNCNEGELREFARLVRRGFQGSDESLDVRIRNSNRLAFHYDADDRLAGIAALKAPSERFRVDLFQKAEIETSPEEFPLELGWVFVDPAHRGHGIALGLCRQLLATVTTTGVYATTQPRNVPMVGTLLALGFERVGEPYPHRNREHVVFWRPLTNVEGNPHQFVGRTQERRSVLAGPEIRTQRLRLSQLVADDASAMYQYRSDPDVCRYQSFEPGSLSDVEAFIGGLQSTAFDTAGTWFQFGIRLQETGLLLGDIGAHFTASDPRQVELGVTVAPKHQGQGFGTEAVIGLLDHLLVGMQKHRVFASVDPRNAPCVALLHRVGMRKEAHFRESLWFKGEWVDDVVFGVLRSEREQ